MFHDAKRLNFWRSSDCGNIDETANWSSILSSYDLLPTSFRDGGRVRKPDDIHELQLTIRNLFFEEA